MAILKEQEAVDYLQRARSCLHPEQDNFANLPLLSKMLEIETTYIERALAKNSRVALVNIDATGFPELPSWISDIKKLLEEYEHIKVQRGRSMVSFLQQVVDISTEGIRGEGKRLVKTLAGDKHIVNALSGLTNEEMELFREIDDPKKESSPLYLERTSPGLLISDRASDKYYSLSGSYYNDKAQGIPESAGLKFVDSKASRRAPFIVFSWLDSSYNAQSLRILTPYSSLSKRSESIGYIDSTQGTKFGPIRVPIETVVDITKIKPEGRFNISSSPDKITIQYAEVKLQDIHHTLLRAYLNLDLMSIPDKDVEILIMALPRVDSVIKDTLKFSERFLDADTFSEQEAGNFKEDLAARLNFIWQRLPNEKLKASLQLAVAEALKPLRDRAEKEAKPKALIERGKEIALQAPRKLLGLPLPRLYEVNPYFG